MYFKSCASPISHNAFQRFLSMEFRNPPSSVISTFFLAYLEFSTLAVSYLSSLHPVVCISLPFLLMINKEPARQCIRHWRFRQVGDGGESHHSSTNETIYKLLLSTLILPALVVLHPGHLQPWTLLSVLSSFLCPVVPIPSLHQLFLPLGFLTAKIKFSVSSYCPRRALKNVSL